MKILVPSIHHQVMLRKGAFYVDKDNLIIVKDLCSLKFCELLLNAVYRAIKILFRVF